MSRMSDMLTRWFEGINRQQDEAVQGQDQGQQAQRSNDEVNQESNTESQRGNGSVEKPAENVNKSEETELTEPVASTSGLSYKHKQAEHDNDSENSEAQIERKKSLNHGHIASDARTSQTSEKVPDIWTEEISPDKYDSSSSKTADNQRTSKVIDNSDIIKEETVTDIDNDVKVESSEAIQDDCDMLSVGEDGMENDMEHDTVQSDSEMSTVTTSEGEQEGASAANDPSSIASSTTNMDRYLIVPQGVSNLEEHLSQQQYTPVISLHYCAAGTSTSTIKVDFTALNERQAANVASNSSVLRVRSSGSNTSANSSSTTTLTSSTDVPSVSSSSTSVGASADNTDRAVQESCTVKDSSHKNDVSENVTNNAEPLSNEVLSNETGSKTVETKAVQGDDEGKNNSEGHISQPTGSASAMDNVEPTETTSGSTAQVTENEPSDSNELEFEGPRRLSLRSSGQTGISSESTRPDISGERQRRYGHSGPPTGSFTLDSGSESDPDSDEELARADRRKRYVFNIFKAQWKINIS